MVSGADLSPSGAEVEGVSSVSRRRRRTITPGCTSLRETVFSASGWKWALTFSASSREIELDAVLKSMPSSRSTRMTSVVLLPVSAARSLTFIFSSIRSNPFAPALRPAHLGELFPAGGRGTDVPSPPRLFLSLVGLKRSLSAGGRKNVAQQLRFGKAPSANHAHPGGLVPGPHAPTPPPLRQTLPSLPASRPRQRDSGS